MTTVFLWAVLITATLFLITIASPLRFWVKLRYRKPGKPEYMAWASYIHPAVITYKYSSEEEQPQFLVFGRAWVRKKRKGDCVDNIDDANNINSAGDANKIDDDTSGDGAVVKSESGNGNTSPKSIGDGTGDVSNINNTSNTGNTGNINDTNDGNDNDTVSNTNGKNAGGKGQKPPSPPKLSIISRIKQRISAIKKHRLYKLAADMVFIKKFSGWLLRGAAGIFKFVSFDRFRLRASVGMRDPAALGKLYGYFIAAASALELRGGRGRGVDLAMEPVFTEERMDVDCEMAGSVTPSVVLWHSLAMLFTFPYWRVLRVMRIGKRRRRGAKSSPSTAG